MKFLLVPILLLFATVANAGIIDDLQDASVTIRTPKGQGSAVLFTRQVGDHTETFVWTAGFNFIVPIRRMHDWAKRSHIEWALDPGCDVPSEDELSRLPVEDAGMPTFMPELGVPTPAKPKPKNANFLFKVNPRTIQLPF